jgi:hypothetical protein
MTKRRIGASLPPSAMIDEASPEYNPVDSGEVAPLPALELPEPTPEEQMAQFEEALKEEDWGHQPC